MRLTLHTDYALRTLIYLSMHEGKLATINDISTRYDISKNHMMKVAQELVHHGFVTSERGRNGGLKLAKAPKDINLGDVIEKMEPDFALVACLSSGQKNCRIMGACGAQRFMNEARDAFMDVLRKYTLEDSVPNREHLLSLLLVE